MDADGLVQPNHCLPDQLHLDLQAVAWSRIWNVSSPCPVWLRECPSEHLCASIQNTGQQLSQIGCGPMLQAIIRCLKPPMSVGHGHKADDARKRYLADNLMMFWCAGTAAQ